MDKMKIFMYPLKWPISNAKITDLGDIEKQVPEGYHIQKSSIEYKVIGNKLIFICHLYKDLKVALA